MRVKKDFAIAVLVTFLMCAMMFSILPTGSQTMRQYDPWADVNDDGRIDMRDIGYECMLFGATGTPINKTQLLLEILAKIDSLNTTLQGLKAYVETRMPKKGKIIISPVLFQPKDNTQTYYKWGQYLSGDGVFYASLQLPNGAIITNITAKVDDGVTDGYVGVALWRYPLDLPYQEMAWMQTTREGAPGEIILYDDTIQYAEIDNQNYIYVLLVGFSYKSINLYLKWIIIEYEYQ